MNWLFRLFRDNSPRGLRRRGDRLRIDARRLSRKARALFERAAHLDAQADAIERQGEGGPDRSQPP